MQRAWTFASPPATLKERLSASSMDTKGPLCNRVHCAFSAVTETASPGGPGVGTLIQRICWLENLDNLLKTLSWGELRVNEQLVDNSCWVHQSDVFITHHHLNIVHIKKGQRSSIFSFEPQRCPLRHISAFLETLTTVFVEEYLAQINKIQLRLNCSFQRN